jgi:glycosyltransferase involved in cell wall biosynthesis
VANVGIRKNQIGLIKAIEPLANTVPLKLIFAGGGSEADPYFREFTQMVNTHSWCEFVGTLNRTELQSEISRASIGILASFEDNCPMVILEAAAAGLAFAASKVGGVPDLIQDGQTGVLFNPDDLNDIRTKVGQLLLNKFQTRDLATRAQKEAFTRFAPRAIAERHVAIYREVILN